jgi:hypothetical protein
MAEARKLRSWSGSQLQALEGTLQRPLQEWQRDWGLAAAGAVRCSRTADDPQVHETRWQPVAPGWWWDAASAAGMLFGMADRRQAPARSLAAELDALAWADLWRRLAALSAGVAGAAGPADCLRPWSGDVIATLSLGGNAARLLLSGDQAEALLPGVAPIRTRAAQRAPLPLWEALAPLHCTLRAELAPVELSLGEVHALRVGDVIGLPHLLEAPLLARTETGGLLAGAYLGKAGNHRAIELTRTPH